MSEITTSSPSAPDLQSEIRTPTQGRERSESSARTWQEGEQEQALDHTVGEQRHHTNAGREEQEQEQETWQSFLQRVSTQDIARRDVDDPVRRAYAQSRHLGTTDITGQRRRAATTSVHPHGRQISAAHIQPVQEYSTRRRPMSLQIQNRPLPRTPTQQQESASLAGEYIVPRWQPDIEASSCPICGHEFNIFFRRHHCRKCGRVVCANCSPHRITIPRQFIVQPPMEGEEPAARRTRTDAVDLAYQDDSDPRGSRSNPALGGGEEVRLCNPCVPDPHPLLPPSYISPNGQHFVSYPRTDSLPSSGRRHRASMPPRQPLGHVNGYQISPTVGSPQTYRRPDRSHRWSSGHNAHVSWAQPSQDSTSGPRGVLSPYGSAPTQSQFTQWPQFGYPGVASDPNAPLPPTPPPPPPPMREEDECPVCHGELPPKGPDGSEQQRELHVISCIQSHSSTTGSRRFQYDPDSANAMAIAASSAVAGEADASSASGAAGETPPVAAPGPSSPSRRRPPGMLVYQATEKDCIGEDDTAQECVICFEEFEVGAEMGRLECLCKFHRTCIWQWWNTKGIGACPVHQGGI